MSEKRITVWVQRFKDRPALMLQWFDPETGRRKSKSTQTNDEDEAEKQRADKEYELNHGLHNEPSRITWEKFRELFEVEYVTPLRPDTHHNYQVTLDLFEEICRPRTLASINERTVSTFAAGLRQRKGNGGNLQAPGTVKVRLQFLRTVLNWAAVQKLIPSCPNFPTVKVPKRKPQPFPLELFERVQEAAGDDQQMKAYLLCGWLAGLRLREALALSWEQSEKAPWIDLNRKRIWLPAGFVKAVEDQWVPLNPVLRDALLALPRHEDGRVFHFIEERNGKPIGAIAVSARVRELGTKAHVKMTMRTLRRGFGCRYAGKVPAQVLQRLMRHASIKTTVDYYANVDDAVEAAVLGEKAEKGKQTAPLDRKEAAS